jgi:hypothetical protein
MNPSNNQTAGIQTSAEGQTPVTPLPQVPAQTTVNPPTIATGAIPETQAPQVIPMTTLPLPTIKPQVATPVSQATGSQLADDKDVIEPEWVNKAKKIVNTTSDDPYKQSEELTALKADYMQKRYNKIVKLK